MLEDPLQNRDEAGLTGHIRDAATGLTYAQARFYDPVTARFHSPDPVGFAGGGPGYFNRYAYTMNDPVNATDPTGEAAMDCCQPKHPRGRQPMQLLRGGEQRGANNSEIGRSAVGGIQNQHEPFSTAAERFVEVAVNLGTTGQAARTGAGLIANHVAKQPSPSSSSSGTGSPSLPNGTAQSGSSPAQGPSGPGRSESAIEAANAVLEALQDASEATDAHVGQPDPEIPPNEIKPDG